MSDAHLGLFYLRPFPSILPSSRGLASWGSDGLFMYDLSAANPPRSASFRFPFGMPARNGVVPFSTGWLVIYGGKYFILRPGEVRSPQQIGLIGIDGHDLYGKPTLFGNTLFVADAMGGHVTAVDITNIDQPKLLAEMNLPEHPGYIIEANGLALIPSGYQGLLLWRYRDGISGHE